MSKLILASASPRRHALLEELGLSFEVRTVDVPELDDLSSPHLLPVELALENARLKAEAVAKLYPERWILGADTVVTLEGRIYGKPASITQAREFLFVFSGRVHEVITGCALLSPKGEWDIFHDSSRVSFRELSPEIVECYLRDVPVLDKAGSYALQEKGDLIIEKVEGSRANVVGLPMERLTPLLQTRGLLSCGD